MINRPLQGIVDFLSNLQTLLLAFNIHPKGKSEMGSHHTVSLREAIEMVNQTLQYVQSCSAKAKELQSLSEKSVTRRHCFNQVFKVFGASEEIVAKH